jgi:hypothetical protein
MYLPESNLDDIALEATDFTALARFPVTKAVILPSLLLVLVRLVIAL